MAIVISGVKPKSIANTPKIIPKGTTGIIKGLVSLIPLKKFFYLLLIYEYFLLKADYMINMNWSFNTKFIINFMLMNMMRVYKDWN